MGLEALSYIIPRIFQGVYETRTSGAGGFMSVGVIIQMGEGPITLQSLAARIS